jgi:D-alanyl-D-alanine carboxypeptidase
MKRNVRFFAGLIVATALAVRADRVDDYVQAQVSEQNVPGLSLAVVREGKVIKAKGYGLADVELNVPATEHTVYQWASLSKQFIAAGILLLEQVGKLKLSDPVARHYTNAPVTWSNVTVRHLLNHTSGIKSYPGLSNFLENATCEMTPEELIGAVRDFPLQFEPGEKFAYNNSGYHLLGIIIEHVSGESWDEFLRKRIFRPLKMHTARMNDVHELIPNRASGYATRSNRWVRAPIWHPSLTAGAGGLVGTVLDLARWDAGLYGDEVLSAASWEQMWAATLLNGGMTNSYGFGWDIGQMRGHRWVAHSGRMPGTTTFILRLLDDKLTVIVLMNGPGNPKRVAIGIAGHYVSGLTLASMRPGKDPHPELSERLKQCLHELAEKKHSDLLTPQFQQNLSKSVRRHAQLKSDLAEVKSFRFLVSEEPSGRERERLGAVVQKACSYKLVTRNGPRFYTFELTPDNRLAWLQASPE